MGLYINMSKLPTGSEFCNALQYHVFDRDLEEPIALSISAIASMKRAMLSAPSTALN